MILIFVKSVAAGRNNVLYFTLLGNTQVAGTLAAAPNKVGVIGVAPKAELVAVKVLSEYSGGGPFSFINFGVIYTANAGADLINMSSSGTIT